MRDAAELRVKESDRLSAVTQNLQAMGAQVEQTDDGWRIPGASSLHGARLRAPTITASPWPLRSPRCGPRARRVIQQRRMRRDFLSGIL